MKNMLKTALVLVTAVCGFSVFAASNGATSAGDTTGEFSENNHTYTVTGTKYVNPSGNDSANRNERGWYAGINITWNKQTQKATGTTAAVEDNRHAHDVASFSIYKLPYNWQNDNAGSGLSGFDGSTYWMTMYVTTATWWAHITPEDAYALGGADYTATLTIAGETFKIVIPATTYNAGLVDSEDIKWFPAVATIDGKVYGDLNVAIKTLGTVDCVADGEITESIAIDENSTLVLNKGSHTIAGLANLTLKGGTFDFDPSAAGCVIATGYEAQDNGNNTWTVIRGHEHAWSFTLNGATLTANCGNMESACDVPNRTTSVTLTVSGGSDGVAPTFAIDNKDTFLAYVNKDGDVASIGEITVVRTTDDGAETTKWYVGDYTASCIVTASGEEKTITQDFSIGGELKTGGYTVASRGVRYDSFAEALAAAEDGDTIYYRNGDMGDQSVTFSVDKDVTLDFGGAAFYYTAGSSDANFYNNGSGTLTLKNVELKQPRYSPTIGSRKYHNITFYGAFVFSDGVKGVTTDVPDYDDLLTINAVNGSIEVQAGLYQCAFAAGDGGSVTIKGGEFWSRQRPNEDYVADGYVIVDATTEGYAYEVVPHEHSFYYETEGNVITIKCKGEGYEGCAWTLNDIKLTLTAADAFEGTTYAGATYEPLDENFLYDGTTKPEIEYYKDGVKVGTPSTFGDYEARVTVTINGSTATAVKAFTIKHVHQFKYDIAPSETLTATCTNIVSTCDIPDHTTAITLSVTDNGDGVAPTFEIANRDAFLGFVNRDATVATVGEITTVRTTDDGAVTTKWYVGNYRSTCVVTISGVAYTLTQDFSIAKTAEYTSGWTVGSRDIRYGSWDEALAAAADGDTIYYRDGDRKFETHEFSIGAKNLTIDFAGYTLTKESYVTMTIKNSGSGALTLQNVVIKQPRGTWSGQIKTEGNIVFGEGVKVVNTAEDSGNYCTITVKTGALIVSNGCYQCGFETDGGTLALEAGKYWQHDKPAYGQYNVGNRVCREIVDDNWKYEIVEHAHIFTYAADGNVITSDCEGEDADYCYWHQNRQTATLTANDAVESTEPYSGASVAYTEVWVGAKPAITYWQGASQLEGAPTLFGTYTAKLTVGGATAEAAFTITPMNVTVTIPNVEHTTREITVDETVISTTETNVVVKHGSAITVTYKTDTGYEPDKTWTKTIPFAEAGDAIDVSDIVVRKSPVVVPPTGSDPETDPAIKPVEGTNGVYAVEVKTNTTTAVMIDGIRDGDTVIVPPQINAVNGTEENPIAADQIVVVADATNTTGSVKVDITPAFTITDSGAGVLIALNSNAVVTVEIEGKEPEQIAVIPELGTAAGTQVAESPFVVTADKVATGVKTIPGLTYDLLSGDTVTGITNVVKTIVAEDTRIVLEAAKDADPAKFYKVQVAK